jgi:hypothetical protein
LSPQGDRVELHGISAIDKDAAIIGHDKTVEATQERGLSGTALADERHALRFLDTQGDSVERSQRAVTLGDTICIEGRSQFSSQSTRV